MRFIFQAEERQGGRIAAVEGEESPVGWIEIRPGRDRRGAFYHLVGIEVQEDRRGRGTGTALLEEAKRYIGLHKAHRLLFDVSPLLTQSAALFVTRFGARYRWMEGSMTTDGRPWPECSCELDFTSPLGRPPDMEEQEVTALSVLDWEGGRPVPRSGISYQGLHTVLLPPMDRKILAKAASSVPGILETLTEALRGLHRHGYGFVWFDATSYVGQPFHYYLMRRSMAL